MKTGLAKEINKEYIDAVKCYEDEISNETEIIKPDHFINLAFLYWCFAFDVFEFNIPNNIPGNFSDIGGNRYQTILDLGISKFPTNLELHFWNSYFKHIIFSEEFSERDCKDLMVKYNDSEKVVPYFFLYQFNNEKYKEERNVLLEECERNPIAKNIYIKSIIG